MVHCGSVAVIDKYFENMLSDVLQVQPTEYLHLYSYFQTIHGIELHNIEWQYMATTVESLVCNCIQRHPLDIK